MTARKLTKAQRDFFRGLPADRGHIMNDLRASFYNYAMNRMNHRGIKPDEEAAEHFADWALNYMPDSKPVQAYAAYTCARTPTH